MTTPNKTTSKRVTYKYLDGFGKDALSILKNAKDVFMGGPGWCRGYLKGPGKVKPTPDSDTEIHPYCMTGAVLKVAGVSEGLGSEGWIESANDDNKQAHEALCALASAIAGRNIKDADTAIGIIVAKNDSSQYEAIDKVFNKAIKGLERKVDATD